jgi:hypothetical protein
MNLALKASSRESHSFFIGLHYARNHHNINTIQEAESINYVNNVLNILKIFLSVAI